MREPLAPHARPAPDAAAHARGRRRVPAWLRLDRAEAALLLVFAAIALAPLVALATRPLIMTGADSGLVADQLQYFAWIRSASETVVIENWFAIDARDPAYFVHPGYLLSGALHALGVPVAVAYQALWKPVAILLVFFGFLAYVRRLLPPGGQRWTALALALFFVSPIAAVIEITSLGGEGIRERVAFFTGEAFPFTYLWGYMMTAVAVALVPIALLATERARVAARRPAGRSPWRPAALAATLGLLAAWIQPWSAVAFLITLAGVELVLARRDGLAAARRALPVLAPIVAATALPLAYYFAMSKADPSWGLAGSANNELGDYRTPWRWWPWWAWLIGLGPIVAPALLAYRRVRGLDWQQLAVRWLPVAMVLQWLLIAALQVGTFPYHSTQGISLPLAILAVAGVASVLPAASRRGPGWRAAVAIGVAAVCLLGVGAKLNALRVEVNKGGQPYLLEPGEDAALDYLERADAPGGVLAPIYSGLAVPYRTGRDTWVGQVSWTPDFRERVDAADALFAGELPRDEALRLVRDARVRFLLSDCRGRADLEPTLRPALRSVRRFGCATVYELDPAAVRRVTA